MCVPIFLAIKYILTYLYFNLSTSGKKTISLVSTKKNKFRVQHHALKHQHKTSYIVCTLFKLTVSATNVKTTYNALVGKIVKKRFFKKTC